MNNCTGRGREKTTFKNQKHRGSHKRKLTTDSYGQKCEVFHIDARNSKKKIKRSKQLYFAKPTSKKYETDPSFKKVTSKTTLKSKNYKEGDEVVWIAAAKNCN